jgi:metal-responsive CopG/Arc/MetJ family transcriptional regulator
MQYMHTKIHTKRITISLPEPLYNRLKKVVAEGEVSSFAAEAMEKELARQTSPKKSAVETFRELQKMSPKLTRAQMDEWYEHRHDELT